MSIFRIQSFAFRIALLSFLVAGVFATVIASVGIYLTRDLLREVAQDRLEQEWLIVSRNIEVEVERILLDAEDMARNPLILNALTDSDGRNNYLRPYVASQRTQDVNRVKISVHDFSGAEIASNDPGTRADYSHASWLESVMQGRQRALGPGADGRVLVIVPVILPSTKSAEGFVVWSIDLMSLLRHSAIALNDSISAGLRSSDGAFISKFGERYGADDLVYSGWLNLGRGLHELSVALSIRQNRSAISIPVNRFTLISVCGIAVVLLLAFLVARIIGRRLAEPVATLGRIAAEIDPDHLEELPALPGGTEEVAALSTAFSGMMDRLRLSHEMLERRVRERTRDLEIAQNNARDQARLISSIVDNIADGIVTVERSGAITAVNGAAEEIFGYRSEELIGADFRMLIADEYGQSQANERPNFHWIEDRIKVGATHEYVGRRRDGTVFPMELAVSKSADKGNVLLTGVVRDISERRNAEIRLKDSQAHLEQAQQLAGLGSWEWNPDTDGMSLSDGMREIIGLENDASPASWKEFAEYIHPDDRRMVFDRVMSSIRTGDPYKNEHRIVGTDGNTRVVEERGEPKKAIYSGELRLLVTSRDITEVKKARDELRLAASVFDATAEAIAITDIDGVLVAAKNSFAELAGRAAFSCVGKAMSDVWSVSTTDLQFSEIHKTALKYGHWQGEFSATRSDGEPFVAWMSVSVADDADGNADRVIVVLSDITDLKNKEERIRHQAFHDSLTDLPNRTLLRDRLEHAVVSSQRSGKPLALFFLDLDRFKIVNDSLGHDAGDQLLVTISRRLKNVLRKKDTIARLGGDEFVVMVDDFESTSHLDTIARKIIDVVARPMSVNGQSLTVSTSIGVALYPNDAQSVEGLMQNADAAMYQAKAAGRNNFVFYRTEMNSHSVDRLKSETALKLALERKEFELFYQPKIDFAGGLPCGLEALIRWRNPERGLVSPAEFIGIAEETGLIVPIGEWVIRESCRQLRAWQDEGVPTVPVAINLSAQQFRDASVISLLEDALRDSALQARMLDLEITETVAMSREGEAKAVMHDLRRRGHSLMIDDFGTAYSSLSYLRQLPITGVKIDRSFVDGIQTEPEDRAIVEAVLGIAHALDLVTVAEGVETPEQAEFLAGKGCETAQGYLYARPMPADACARWLTEKFLADGAADKGSSAA